MTTDHTAANKALLQKIIRVFETGDMADVDALIDVNYVDHQGLGGAELKGTDGFRRVVLAARAESSNLTVAIENLAAEGDRLAARLRWRGKSAAGQPFERDTIDVLRIRDGRLAEHWGASVNAPAPHYRSNDWIDPRVEIRPSSIHGRGMFARTRIGAGEVVTIWGGTFVLTEPDVAKKRALSMHGCSLGTIGESLYFGSILGENEDDRTYLINHSCDPNVWMHDEVTLTARRDITAGEELTMDYAMIEDREDWVGPFVCRCGSPFCRGRFTGKDWRREDLQARYGEHFSPFINERIDRLKAGVLTAPAAVPIHPLEIVEYDPRWPEIFIRERGRLQAALGPLAVDIQHIGSTSVPGMAAKPVIDIAIGIRSYPWPAAAIDAVGSLGYEHKGEYGIPRRHYFRKGIPRTHHIHVLEIDSPQYTGHILFRDYLRTHPETVQRYESLKRDLVRTVQGDHRGYEDGKAAFIQNVIAAARSSTRN